MYELAIRIIKCVLNVCSGGPGQIVDDDPVIVLFNSHSLTTFVSPVIFALFLSIIMKEIPTY